MREYWRGAGARGPAGPRVQVKGCGWKGPRKCKTAGVGRPRGRTVCTVWDLNTRAGEPAVPTHHAALAEHQEIATTLNGRDVAWGAGAGYAALPMNAL